MKSILIVDDEINICTLLSKFLSKNGYQVESTMQGNTALKMLEASKYDLVLCDYRLKDTDGAQLLSNIREISPQTVVVIITGYSDVRTAVDMVKKGAFDYISKPLYPDEILSLVKKALEYEQPPLAGMGKLNQKASKQYKESNQYPLQDQNYVFGKSKVAKELYRQITLVAPTDYTVIIYGETGTGKESVAHLIHEQSNRHKGPFIALDCGALSKELAASELFGHEKGAFTGAVNSKEGAFEQAKGGTLFLDEIANLSYDIQVALLRVIQEKQVRHVGSVKEIAVDVRLIVASNEKLQDAVLKGKFREDLYHRFNEFTIHIPPLRDREDDLGLLVDNFLEQTAKELDKPKAGISKEVMECLYQYDWPGNIRELKNIIRRACLLTPDGQNISMESMPLEMKETHDIIPIVNNPVEENLETADIQGQNDLKSVALKAEYQKIMNVLKAVKYNKTKAAQMLNIDRKTLYNKLRLLNISY